MWLQHVAEASQPVLSYWSRKKTVQKKGEKTEMNTVDGIQGIIKEM